MEFNPHTRLAAAMCRRLLSSVTDRLQIGHFAIVAVPSIAACSRPLLPRRCHGALTPWTFDLADWLEPNSAA